MSAIPNFLLLALGAKGLLPPKEQGQAQWRGQGSLQAPPHTSGVQALNTTSLSGIPGEARVPAELVILERPKKKGIPHPELWGKPR